MNVSFPLIDISSLDRYRWSEFIMNQPEGSVFQSPEFYHHLLNVPNYQPAGIACTDENNNIAGILLGFIIRERQGIIGSFYARAIVHAGPLIAYDQPDKLTICDILLKGFIALVKKKSLVIQLRNHFNLSDFREIFKKNGFLFQEHLNLFINIRQTYLPLQTISKRKLQQIRKSLANGAVISEASTPGEVDDLYSILHHLYKHRVKKPLPGKGFFRAFLQSSAEQKLGVILLVKYQGKVVAGMVCPITPGKVIYEWYVCGLDREYKSIHPSVLVTWAGIEYARTNNIPIFDFMGMGNPGKAYGVRDFKMGFGGTIVKYGRFLRINNQGLYTVAKLGLKILASLKRV
ncbi:MAG: GNAT family N-acetyltransferase [Bacteroidetes bacterium]|nr:GNAT family N-acetyltransferase [Bacteroidota bacterium]